MDFVSSCSVSLSFLFSRLTVLVFVFLGLMLAWFPFGLHFSGRRLFVSGFRLLVPGRRLWLSFAVHLLWHRCVFAALLPRLRYAFAAPENFLVSLRSKRPRCRQSCRLESSVSFAASLPRRCALLCVIGARRTFVFDGLLPISYPHLVLQEWGVACRILCASSLATILGVSLAELSAALASRRSVCCSRG